MNRPPSPHPIKLASIREHFETTTYTNANTQCDLQKILNELKEIKKDIEEIKNKLI